MNKAIDTMASIYKLMFNFNRADPHLGSQVHSIELWQWLQCCARLPHQALSRRQFQQSTPTTMSVARWLGAKIKLPH